MKSHLIDAVRSFYRATVLLGRTWLQLVYQLLPLWLRHGDASDVNMVLVEEGLYQCRARHVV